MVANCSEETLTVPKHTVLGSAQQVSEEQLAGKKGGPRRCTQPPCRYRGTRSTPEKDDILLHIKDLKASLKMAYKELAKANRKAHQNNKRFHERKAKARHFEANDLVYLYTPVMKPGLTKKFRKFWSGTYKVIRKVSELNYEIISKDNRKQIVHVNRIKRCYNQSLWNPKRSQETSKSFPKREAKSRASSEGEGEEFRAGRFPLRIADNLAPENECTKPQSANLDTPDTGGRTIDTPSSSKDDPSYSPLETPRSRRELQSTRVEPPITRSRARNVLKDVTDA